MPPLLVVRSGKRIFPDGLRLGLPLVEERRFRKDVKRWNVTPQAWVANKSPYLNNQRSKRVSPHFDNRHFESLVG
jgi:hypothetical protein